MAVGLLLALARLSELVVASLVLAWAVSFRASFLPSSSSSSSSLSTAHLDLDHLYSVLHPLLMVIGLILLSSEGVMAHRWRWAGWARKSAHLVLHGAALGFGVLGIWAKFKSRDGFLANFYSLHSWMGLTCISLFATQWMVGFMSFWHRNEGRRTRATVLPWHVFIGLSTYGLAVATAETGLQEKLTFLQTKRGLPHRSLESSLVNTLGLGLAFLCGLVVFAAISPKQQQQLLVHKVQLNFHADNKGHVGYQNSDKVVHHECSKGRWTLS